MVHTEGGLWPPHVSCYLREVEGAGPRFERSELKRGGGGGSRTRRYMHKAAHTQGCAHRRRFVTTVGVLLFNGGAGASPRVERSEPKHGEGWWSTHKAVYYTRWCTHKVVHAECGLRPPQKSCYLRRVRGTALCVDRHPPPPPMLRLASLHAWASPPHPP